MRKLSNFNFAIKFISDANSCAIFMEAEKEIACIMFVITNRKSL